MVKKVNFKDFKPEHVMFDKPEEVKSKAAGVVYYRIRVTYKYPDGSMGPLYIEGPMENSRGPLNDPKEGKDNWNVFTKYDLSNAEQYAFVNRDDRDGKELGTMYKLLNASAKFVYDNRKECGLTNLKNLDACFDKFREIMMWTLEDGYPKPGTNPAKYWNLTKYEWQGKTVTTNFTLPSADSKDGIVLNWSEIDGNKVQIEHIPVIKIENITIASQIPSIKMSMYSSVITKWSARSRENMQAGTMAKMLEDAAKAAEIEELKKQLMEERAKNATRSPARLPPNPVKIDIVENVVVPTAQAPPMVIPGISEVVASMASVSVSEPPKAPEVAPLPLPLPPAPVADLKAMLGSTAGTTLPGNIELPF
jgi:ribosomal protein L29